jgi:hypothetical protein
MSSMSESPTAVTGPGTAGSDVGVTDVVGGVDDGVTVFGGGMDTDEGGGDGADVPERAAGPGDARVARRAAAAVRSEDERSATAQAKRATKRATRPAAMILSTGRISNIVPVCPGQEREGAHPSTDRFRRMRSNWLDDHRIRPAPAKTSPRTTTSDHPPIP